jgi:hypothetical protein
VFCGDISKRYEGTESFVDKQSLKSQVLCDPLD